MPTGPGFGLGSGSGGLGGSGLGQSSGAAGVPDVRSTKFIDPRDTQPERTSPVQRHRTYVPAVWKPRGAGGGHPKVSGGVEIDTKTGHTAPRGWNRTDQRYSQPFSTIDANRQARASAEYASAVILQGEGGVYEVRTPSGNNYDVSANLFFCQCPDWLKLEASGYGIVRCKHIYLCMLANADRSLTHGVPWSTSKLAEQCSCAVRVAELACQNALLPATKKHNVWVIDPEDGASFAAIYRERLILS